MRETASYFSILCGFAMLATWGFLLSTGRVPELQTDTFKTLFLLTAEFLTAISLILGGFGLATGKSWGLRADLAALGMLLYCTIFSTGALGAGSPQAAIFFGSVAVLAFIFSTRFILESAHGGIQ